MLCECGCGGLAPIAQQSSTRFGWVRGKPLRFILGHCNKNRPTKSGYRRSGHDKAHRVIAEKALGKQLPVGVEVHHVDGDIGNTTPRLVICQDRHYHQLLHVRARVYAAGGDPNSQRICGKCQAVKNVDDFYGAQRRCKSCSYQGVREWHAQQLNISNNAQG